VNAARFILPLALLVAALPHSFGQGAKTSVPEVRPPGPKTYRVVIYAQLLENAQVTLSDGSEWAMDKGDCFPIDMFKEQQTKVVLKVGGSTFMIETPRVRVMKEHETEAALKSYRVTLAAYAKTHGDRWLKEAEKSPPAKGDAAKAGVAKP
jgi:hypothetical protein